MKVLVIHRFYWPDTPPYASMLRAIVRCWVESGHEVDVLSSQPSYKPSFANRECPAKEILDGANVFRMRLPSEQGKPVTRILNSLKLGLGIFWHGITKGRYDVIMVSTSPPVLGGVFAAVAAKCTGARFIYHCMDIHPEIGRISGEFNNPSVFSFLSKLDQWSCKQAAPVVVLSEDMADTIKSRDTSLNIDTLVLNNFSQPLFENLSSDLPFEWPSEACVILFAGNIGRFQGLDVLIDAMAALIERKDVRLIIMGEGAEKKRLKTKAETLGARVTFIGHQPVEIAKLAMAKADIGFVSLVPELFRYAYPSKTIAYIEQGCPILLVVEPESALAQDVLANNIGVSVPVGDVDALKEVIMSIADNPKRFKEMRLNSHILYQRQFSHESILKQWSSLLEK